MRVSTIIIITLLILALYYYTAESFPIVQTVGNYMANMVKDAAVVTSLEEYSGEIRNDLKRIPEKITGIVDNIKDYFKKD
ncbi:MAG: hypothetical protein AABX72_00775 [Nanoarchaeota archaeon]